MLAEAVLQERTRGAMPKSKVQVKDNKTADAGLVKQMDCKCNDCGGDVEWSKKYRTTNGLFKYVGECKSCHHKVEAAWYY
jgi:hypothetical protein